MPSIEVLPNSSSTSAPGWAYVPDTGYDPSKAPIQPSGPRKRNARITGAGGAETTARQNNALLKRLADLDKDNQKDVHLPSRQKEAGVRASKGKTAATRKILLAQKTFANYVADEEALAALEPQPVPTLKPRESMSALNNRTASVLSREVSSSTAHKHPSATGTSNDKVAIESQTTMQTPGYAGHDPSDAWLLQSSVPAPPSAALLEALVSAPPLTYNAARAAPSTSGKPQRYFCEFCGYWGQIKCIKCGARVCGLVCKKAHDEERCQKYFG